MAVLNESVHKPDRSSTSGRVRRTSGAGRHGMTTQPHAAYSPNKSHEILQEPAAIIVKQQLKRVPISICAHGFSWQDA